VPHSYLGGGILYDGEGDWSGWEVSSSCAIKDVVEADGVRCSGLQLWLLGVGRLSLKYGCMIFRRQAFWHHLTDNLEGVFWKASHKADNSLDSTAVWCSGRCNLLSVFSRLAFIRPSSANQEVITFRLEEPQITLTACDMSPSQ
jgi:hypothetical protein